jgi:hypothetical protein
MKGTDVRSKFVLCVRADGEEDLQERKVYQTLPDRAAARDDYLRVIDESGEDYLYPADLFIAIKLPPSAIRQLVSPAKTVARTTAPRRISRR